jgi:predicted GH43/DUF377 family glycosyl hydrolase
MSPILLSILTSDPFQDLEELSQDFVLESKRIQVPGYPHAFNPAIIRWRGMLLMSFRTLPNERDYFSSEIGIVILNEDFEPISTPQLLNLRDEQTIAPCRAEDARFLVIDDRLFMIYDDNAEEKLSRGGFRMYVAELHYDADHFIISGTERLSNYEGESKEIREKSWAPFDYQGHLLLAYSLLPHKIFYPRLDGSEICDTIASSESPLSWDFGILRGGTSALPADDHYLGFFHSSKVLATAHSEGNSILHYFMGAYTFSREPPFTITSISPSPLIGKHFYSGINYEPYWKPIRCVFPCGFIWDERFIWIAYGRDDHECWIVKIDKLGLLQSLIPLNICD